MLTSRQLGSGTSRTGVGVRLGSRFILACQALEHRSSLIGTTANSNPPCPTEARLVPAAAEQAVERLLMRKVEDGNGRARAGREGMNWRGRVSLEN
uniref:Uncharacterized protein n=1 Tax=Oryza punctata TaxID=4537 RepID=A0A0E0ML45_ORYPU